MIAPILQMGNPILRRKSIPFAVDGDLSLKNLVDDLAETMRSYGGVGIAAPQIGILIRRIVAEGKNGDAVNDFAQ
jgi:peptide deformylase